jgi:pSer/pThr/pTyr-binding forkhead associated (FHA) protein
MDDQTKPLGATGHSYQGPHWKEATEVETPAGFEPLRLVLQPAGPAVVLRRPVNLVGRHSEADVRLIPPDVSRRHCRIVFEEGHWEVVDLQSLNGIYVNGYRVSRAVLHHTDRIRIGGCTLEVDLPSVPAPRAADASNPSAKVLRSIAQALPPESEVKEKRRAS